MVWICQACWPGPPRRTMPLRETSKPPAGGRRYGPEANGATLPSTFAGHSMLCPYEETSKSVAGGDGQVVDVGTAAGRFVPHLEAGHEVEDVRRSEDSACAVDREHRLPADIVEINVLH